jgi:hypothetical protein
MYGRYATLVVDSAARSDTRLKALKKRVETVSALEAECDEKIRKANEKIAAHQALTAHKQKGGGEGAAAKGAGAAKAKGGPKRKKGGGKAAAAKATAEAAAEPSADGDEPPPVLPAVPSAASLGEAASVGSATGATHDGE